MTITAIHRLSTAFRRTTTVTKSLLYRTTTTVAGRSTPKVSDRIANFFAVDFDGHKRNVIGLSGQTLLKALANKGLIDPASPPLEDKTYVLTRNQRNGALNKNARLGCQVVLSHDLPDNLDDAFKWTGKLDKFEEKKQYPLYTTGGQLAKYTATPACGNYNGVVGLAKAKGLAVPITFKKVRMIHNLADKVKQLETPNAKITGTWETRSCSSKAEETSNHSNFLRPLSPHLPIYKPQRNSIISILNRVSAAYLVLGVVYFDLVYLKLGSVCLSFDSFYLYLFYSSKLTAIPLQMAALATVYHLVYGIKHLAAYRLR